MSQSKENIVFIHGFANHPQVWNSTVAALSDYHCHLVDLNQLSQVLIDKEIIVDTPNLAQLVEKELQGLGIDHFHLVGHSMGGYVSAAYANQYPKQLKSLTLVHSILGAELEEKVKIRTKSVQLLARGEREKNVFLRAMVNNLFNPEFKKTILI